MKKTLNTYEEQNTPCTSCAQPVHPLARFPKGLCLDCHAARVTPLGHTPEEIRAAFAAARTNESR